MNVTGTMMNYYFHCKRQCYLFGNKLNLEDNSEAVKIGKALHEERDQRQGTTEIAIDNIKVDKLTQEYLTEIKKSDADAEAAKWQLLYYLKVLKDKGIERKGRLEFIEKNRKSTKTVILELTKAEEDQLKEYTAQIESLISQEEPPPVIHDRKCKKCAYYEYCYI